MHSSPHRPWPIHARSRARRILALGPLLLAATLTPRAARAAQSAVSTPSTSVNTYYGALGTRVPIAVPAFRGLEPSLELSYSSAALDGQAGIGAGLDGFSFIERASAAKGAPRYDATDIYLLDGQELVPCAAGSASPSCTTGGTHSTRIENYQRIRYDGAANTWTVWRKDGTRQVFTSIYPAYRAGVLVGTFRWGLASVSDTSANTVTYGWWCDGSPVLDCYPDTVSYNGATVRIYREPRPDPITFGNGSSTLGRSSYRLRSVLVSSSASTPSTLRAYRLSYAQSGPTGRSLLASVQQYGRDVVIDGAGTIGGGTALPAVTFSWQGEGNAFASLANWVNNPYIGPVGAWTRLADFNGDGRTDILQQYNYDNYVYLSNGGSFGAPVNWVSNPYRGDPQWTQVGDFNGDGKADLFQQYGYNTYVYLSTGSGFAAPVNWAYNPYRGDVAVWTRLGDFNGDGKTDMLQQYGYDNYVYLSTGSSFAAPVNWGYNPYRSDAQWTQFGDFNGDGRIDLLQQYNNDNYVYLSTGSGFAAPVNWVNNPYRGPVAAWTRFGDFNGDGKTDLLQQYNYENYVYLSTGASFAAPINWGTNVYRGDPQWSRFGDFNGDGKTDLLQQYGNQNYTFLSTGNGFAAVTDWGTNPYRADAQWTSYADFNGDGKLDMLQQYGQANYVFTANPGALLVTAVGNGLGGTTTAGYTNSTAWSNTYLPLGTNLPTVSLLRSCDGRGNCSQTSYSYQGGLWSSSERRFLGFRKVTSVLDAAGNYTETYYHQHVGCIAKPEVTYYRDPAGNLYRYSTFGYAESASPPYTSLMTDRWEYECNLSTSCRRTLIQIGYDQYGNGYLTYEYGDYDVAGDERTALRGLYPNTSAYVVGLPAYENMYAGIGTGGALLKQTLHEYDGNTSYAAAPTRGLVTRQQAWNNQTGGYITRRFGYDAWGNRTSETDELGYASSTEYDAVDHVHETRRCNALGQCTANVWDSGLDRLRSETDINGNVTSYTYDALGRPLETRLADGSVQTLAYLDRGDPTLQRVRKTLSDGTADGLWTEVYEDGLGREYRRVKEGGIVEETLYSDGSQRVWKKSLAYGPGETARYVVFGFDGLGRLRTATNPDGTSGQRIYGNGFVRTLDETGREKVVWTDAYGQTSAVQEKVASGYQTTSSQYDLLGNLVRVTDAQGNLTTVSWDSLGRKLTGCDPDTGCTSYTYAAAGHILSTRDAKGQTSTFTYDALGRRVTKTLADGRQIRWYYDEAGHGAGKGVLTSVSELSGSESRSYDAAGRVISATKCVSGVCYTLAYGYDAAGRLARVTYPDGEVVTYGYDAQGRVQSVGGYVSALGYNARSQLLSASYTNGATSSYAYADARQWLTGVTVASAAGTLYQASYGYDAGGRVTSMSSSTNPMSNLGYGYDALGRLTSVTGSQAHSFAYDAVGNMTSNAQLGGYQYADAAHRHAVTTAGSGAYGYDANGSLTSGGGRTFVWDADNRLAQVTTASGATTFSYDAEGQRVMKSGPGGTYRYFGPLVELGPAGLTKYYYAGSLLVARRDPSGAAWYHTDHAGSVRALTNAAGQKTASYDYAPFGAVVAASGPLTSRLGYGGHVTDETGLVYMNARYYDPQLGRFISADVVVPASENPQALNRYTYVYNNPVSNTDPTGHVPVVAAVVTAFSVGVATGFAGAAFTIAVVGAATVAAGYVLKDPLLTSLGGILLGAAGGYIFGAGFLGGPLTAQAAFAGGAVSALTSPISPLDPKLKQAIGWAYSLQGLLSDSLHVEERIDQGADRLGSQVSEGDRATILAQKQARLDSLSAQDRALISDPARWTSSQRLYGEAVERATRGALSAGEAIALNASGGLVGPGSGLLTQALEVTTGWIPGVRIHSVLHDAGGFLARSEGFGVGPGYFYLGYNAFGLPKTLPIAGQLEGLAGGGALNAIFPRLF